MVKTEYQFETHICFFSGFCTLRKNRSVIPSDGYRDSVSIIGKEAVDQEGLVCGCDVELLIGNKKERRRRLVGRHRYRSE